MTDNVTRTKLEQTMNDLGIKFTTRTVQSGFMGTEYRLVDNKTSLVTRIEKHLGVRGLFKGGARKNDYPYHVTFF